MLENTRQTKSCSDGYVILDDTGNPKSGNSTFATRRQWMGSLGKVDNGQVVVTSHYADSRKDWPIEHRPYLPKNWVEEENERHGEEIYEFKSKLDLGKVKAKPTLFWSLLMIFISETLSFLKGCYQSHPFCWQILGMAIAQTLLKVQKKGFVPSLYANRRIYFDLDSCEKNEHQVKDLVTVLSDDAFVEKQYTKANGEVSKAYVAEMNLEIKNLSGKRRVLIVKPTPFDDDMDKIDVLMTDDTENSIPFLLRSWSFRKDCYQSQSLIRQTSSTSVEKTIWVLTNTR